MRSIQIYFDMDNADFDADEGAEIARILRDLADNYYDAGGSRLKYIYDANGNRIGQAEIIEED